MKKIDPKEYSNYLRRLAKQGRTPEAQAEIEAALHSKWEGVQVVAGRILAEWRGRKSVEAIRAWLLRSFGKEHGSTVQAEATKALAECFEAQDIAWILDLYFSVPDVYHKHTLALHLIRKLPAEEARDRIVAEINSSDLENRRAAMKAIAHMDFQDRHSLLSNFTRDPDPDIRKAANNLLDRQDV